MQHGIETLATTAAIGAVLVESKAFRPTASNRFLPRQHVGDASAAIERDTLDWIVGQGEPPLCICRTGACTVRRSLRDQRSSRQRGGLQYGPVGGGSGELKALAAHCAVPGFGSWTDPGTPSPSGRWRFPAESLAAQVGFVISQGRPRDQLSSEVHVGGELLVSGRRTTGRGPTTWKVYRGKMTVPAAPFDGSDPKCAADGRKPSCLMPTSRTNLGYIDGESPASVRGHRRRGPFHGRCPSPDARKTSKVDLLVILATACSDRKRRRQGSTCG